MFDLPCAHGGADSPFFCHRRRLSLLLWRVVHIWTFVIKRASPQFTLLRYTVSSAEAASGLSFQQLSSLMLALCFIQVATKP